MPLKVLPAPKVSTWGISELAGGLNLQDLEYKIADSQSPDCKNVWFNNRVLCKRWGTEKVNATSVGSTILAMYDKFFQGKIVFAAGTHMYTMDPNLGTVTSIYDGLTANKGVFFRYSVTNATILWYLNGAQFVQYDGVTVKPIDPYVPNVVVNRAPTGGGTTFPGADDYNRIGAGFKNTFTGDGSSKAYTLTDNNLDATAVTVTVGGVNKVEGIDFTVNRTTGVVTFTSAPAGGVNNNVVITAYKTRSDWTSSIYSCTCQANFGGTSDSRIFFGGNGTSYIFWSAVGKPGYWPVNQYTYINTADDTVTGFGKQNDTLMIFKGRSVYGMTYSFDASATTNPNAMANFPTVNVNDSIGCDCPGTIRLINNKLTWLTSYLGPMTLVNQLNISSSETVYRNVNAIGRNINGNSARAGLLSEANLENAVAVDFGQKYWIAVNGHVYLWDYGISPYMDTQNVDKAQMALSWWYFDNLDIQCFCQDGTDLYFGDSNGFINHFVNSFSDITKALVGNAAQVIPNGNFAKDSNGEGVPDGFTLSNASAVSLTGGEFTFVATARWGNIRRTTSPYLIGHRHFVIAAVKASSSQVGLFTQSTGPVWHPGDSNYHQLYQIIDASSLPSFPQISDSTSSSWSNISVKNFMAIDMGTDANNPLYNLTADQMAALVGSAYWEGSAPLFTTANIPISAYWRMKINHLGAPNYLKNIMKIWFACRSDVATTMQITYYTDMRPDGISDHQPIHITSFSWWPWNWAKFSWGVHNWFGMWRKTPPMRNVMAFSVRFDNANANEDLNVSDIIVAFIPIREVRRSV